MQEPRPSFLEVLRSIEDLIAEITGLNCIVEMFEDEGRQMFSIPRRTPVYCKHVSDLLGERAPCAKPNGCGEAGRSGRRASPRIFTCNAGMSSVVVPLSAGGEVVGEVLYGPVLMRLGGTTDAAFEAARALAEEHDLSIQERETLHSALSEAQTASEEDLSRIAARVSQVLDSVVSLFMLDHTLQANTSTLTHDLGTRLQAVLAHAENLAEEYKHSWADTDAERHIEGLMLSVRAMASTVQSMATGTHQEYHFTETSLPELVFTAVGIYEAEAIRRGIEFDVKLESPSKDIPPIRASVVQMQNAVNCLVHNAAKYSYRDRPVHITVGWQQHECELKVENCGVGIEPDEIMTGRIFEAGYRGRLLANEYRTGGGRGLTTVREVVERHGGIIEVESVPTHGAGASNGGPWITRFRVVLPLGRQTEAQ